MIGFFEQLSVSDEIPVQMFGQLNNTTDPSAWSHCYVLYVGAKVKVENLQLIALARQPQPISMCVPMTNETAKQSCACCWADI